MAPPFPTHYLTVHSVTYPGRDLTSDCAWPADSLEWMLKQQALRHRSYNEVVFASEPIVSGFPHSVEAFFLPVEAVQKDEVAKNWIRLAHRAFLDEYKVSEEDVPLLTFKTWGGGKGPAGDPFSVADWQ